MGVKCEGGGAGVSKITEMFSMPASHVIEGKRTATVVISSLHARCANMSNSLSSSLVLCMVAAFISLRFADSPM